MKFNKISLAAGILVSSCVFAGYSVYSEAERPRFETQATQQLTGHSSWVNDFLEMETALYGVSSEQGQQARQHLQQFYEAAHQSLRQSLKQNKSSAQLMVSLDKVFSDMFAKGKASSFSTALAEKSVSPEIKNWLVLSVLRQAGLNATLVAVPDHYHIYLQRNGQGYEWLDNHLLDTRQPVGHDRVLGEYGLWSAFDRLLAANYIASGMRISDDAIEAILLNTVLVDNDAQAHAMYVSFLTERGRESELALLEK